MAFTHLVTSDNPNSLDSRELFRSALTTNINFNGLPQDLPVKITFDSDVNDHSNEVMSWQEGTITYNKRGYYQEIILASFGRVPGQGAGSCYFNFRSVVNGVPSAARTAQIINNSNELRLVPIIHDVYREQGDTIFYEIWTDSIGNDAGSLRSINITNPPSISPSIEVIIKSKWLDRTEQEDILLSLNGEAFYINSPNASIFSYGSNETSLETGIVFPYNITVEKLSWAFPASNPALQNIDIAILKDGVSTGTTFSILTGQQDGEENISILFTKGERISFQCLTAGGPFIQSINISGTR